MPWYTTEDARRDALRQAEMRERARCADELELSANNLVACQKSENNYAAISALREHAARFRANGCSSFCADGEPCSISADGRCDAEETHNAS